ncbi:Uu.00g093750.m01.CDS01 [Anthostomella pinea]|uniref:Uu.00g093750.m01.CDS01 n=1 Tax=Anthostomella pinea TaxID=933095 RepID=A0AAI8YI72_9PEZI|nr:Uu.00g093750.m01.CDS01 [Anthostomella pinea]
MTATPSKHQLWHPTRGISFSPGPRSPTPSAHDARGPDGSPAAAAATERYVFAAPKHSSDAAPMSDIEAQLRSQPSMLVEDAMPAFIRAGSNAPPKPAGQDAATPASEESREPPPKKATDDPPFPALDFKIVDDLFYAAKKAPAGSSESFWSYTQYRGKADDGTEQKVKVHYCRSKHTMERVCQQYFIDEEVLGFDLEWVPDAMKTQGLKKNISLIQLASPSRIGLFHVALFKDEEEMVGPSFRAIMEDPGITKVGVAIKGDCTRVRNFLDIHSRGLMELSHMYKLVTFSSQGQYQNINKRLAPLALQVEQYLHLPLFKGTDVRSSDWSRPLNMDQVIYSASDAYAGLHLYATLEHHRKQLVPCPPPVHHAERNLPIRQAEGIELATVDDAVETVEDTAKTEAVPAPSGKYVASVLESIQIEDLVKAATTITTPDNTKAAKKTTAAASPAAPATPAAPKDSRVEAAEDRAATYRAAHPKSRAVFSQLRAYYLWHCYGLTPEAVGRLLRNPPLKTATIASYILTVVQFERSLLLGVDRDRLREEVVARMQLSALRSRWPGVAGVVGVAGGQV